jgi:iron complex transport system substrate-binding protein
MIPTRSHPQTPSGAPGKGSSRLSCLAFGIAALAALAGGSAALAQGPVVSALPIAPAGPSGQPGATYPLQLTDDEGTVVTLEAQPQRIISLSPANTETVFTLGAGDRLVGGTDYDDYPPQAAALPDVATYTGVLMEQVVSQRPDLVLAAGNNFTSADDIARLRQLGYPVLVVYAKTVLDVLSDIELIGEAVGEAGAATTITDGMRADIATISTAATQGPAKPRTFYEIGSTPQIFGPAPDSFLADLITLAGGDPITTGDPNAFSIPLERLVEADPQVIVVGDALYDVCPADVMARPGWGDMTAVMNGAVRPVNDIVVTRPGPRLTEGLASLARAIDPELKLSGFPPDMPMCVPGAGPSAGASPDATPGSPSP